MDLAKLSKKFEFEIDGDIYSVEPCLYDEETLGLQINYPSGEATQIGLYNFSDLYDLKNFVISQISNYQTVNTWGENSRFFIAPWSGWEQEFSSWEQAIAVAQKYIEEDFEQLRTKHGYKKAEHLIDVRNG